MGRYFRSFENEAQQTPLTHVRERHTHYYVQLVKSLVVVISRPGAFAERSTFYPLCETVREHVEVDTSVWSLSNGGLETPQNSITSITVEEYLYNAL